jgi:hypothetical protein
MRPYLDAEFPDEESHVDASPLRPFVLTDGRTEPVDGTLEIEAQVMTTALGSEALAGLTFEHRDIVRLCAAPMSVAEVAARLKLHIGVARVLVADLAEQGHVRVQRPSLPHAHDPDLIERVIRGLQSIR